jgi:thiosulfate/3-mercaptopyruvate sulfurtransferase
MKRNLICMLLGWAIAANAATCGGHGTRDTMLVSTAWLADHLKDKNLVIVALGPPADYQSHIPGAVPLTMSDISTPMVSGQLMLELPPVEQLHKTFVGLGITNDSRVVLYLSSGNSVQSMTRVYLTLDAMGLGARTSILNGGLKAWKSENRPLTGDATAVTPGQLDLCPQSDVIATLDFVKSNMNHAGVRILDARDPQFYTGQRAGQTHDGEPQRKGHIPGAGNLPYSSLFDADGKFNSPDKLKAQFAEAGAKPGDKVVSYCHIGQQATAVYFAARYLGFDARMYDGSWDEWNVHTELPVEVSK